MRYVVRGLLITGLILATARLGFASCSDDDPTGSKRAQARSDIAMSCDCAAATNHGEYVSCVASHANTEVTNGVLPKSCKGAVKKCAARSTCGKTGFVTCCLANQSGHGHSKCSVRKADGSCQTKGGCTGNFASCCDACAADGSCNATTTTTSTLLPPTTLP